MFRLAQTHTTVQQKSGGGAVNIAGHPLQKVGDMAHRPPPVPTSVNEIKWISKAEKTRRRTVITTIDAISENSCLDCHSKTVPAHFT